MIYFPLITTFVCLVALGIAVLAEGARDGWACGVWSFLTFLAGLIVSAVAWVIYLLWRLLS